MNEKHVPDEYLDAIVNFDLYYSGRVAELNRRFSKSVETNPTERRLFHVLGQARDGLSLSQLRWQLNLDSGYLTRLVQRWRVFEELLGRIPGIAQLRIVQAMRTVEKLLTAHPAEVFLEYRWRKKNKEPRDG